jgi:hypothetical protein
MEKEPETRIGESDADERKGTEIPQNSRKPAGGTMRTNLLLDIVLLLVFLAIYEQRATGLTIHEWGGLIVGVGLMVHILLHWQWVACNTRRFFRRLAGEIRLNYLINGLLFVAFTTAIVSGLMISHVVLPRFGLHLGHSPFWQWLHSLSADVSLWLVALHVALHWGWIVNAIKRCLVAPFFSRTPPREAASVATTTTPLPDSE